MTVVPAFPPLLQGEAVARDPFEAACLRAARGVDAGLVCHAVAADRLAAALVLAPEVPLADAASMLPLCGVGFQNALGALAPPEVAVHLDWDGGLRVNGARCGRLAIAASTDDPDAVPDWIVVGLEIPILPTGGAPGDDPDQTCLAEEGCVEVAPDRLLEAWSRHSLVWIRRWEEEGARPLHAEWRGLAHGIGAAATRSGRTGTFVGIDERFGMLLRDGADTHLIPLTDLLVRP